MSSTKISQTASKMAKKLISIHRTPIKLDRIKSMSIEFSRVGKGNTGVRYAVTMNQAREQKTFGDRISFTRFSFLTIPVHARIAPPSL